MMATIHRVIEDQEEAATFSLVNNIEEQAILEELLEQSKPDMPEACDGIHYLLFTPFRYPPLKYGSRFGGNFEPSLFYGSLNISTALAETAYYRFYFISGMAEPYTDAISLTYSSYTVKINTNKGVFLNTHPFDDFEKEISSPIHYNASQKLGYSMREACVEAFQYTSARDPQKGINVALFTPKAFHSKQPQSLLGWFCKVTSDEIGFISKDSQKRFSFHKEIFLVNGEIPVPAS